MQAKIRKLFIGMIGLGISQLIYAQTDYDKTIQQLGIQSSSGLYFSVVEGLTLNCLWDNIYLPVNTSVGKAAYAQLLSAKHANKRLSRIDYYQQNGSGTLCTLDLVEVTE